MSVRPADIMFGAGFAPVQGGSELTRPHGGGYSFQDALAVFAVGNGASGESGKQAEKAAEILHLEMMRSALFLDDSPVAPPLDAGRMDTLLAAFNVTGQNVDTASRVPASPDGSGSAGTDAALKVTASSSSERDGEQPIAAVISRASRRYGIEESLIKAVIQAESNFKPTAVSSAGARGLMQLMPATASSLGVTDPFNPEQNVMAGTRFLKDMLNRYGGDLDKALAAYNWGPGNLDRGQGRLPRETREYLVKVKKLYEEYSVG